MGCDGGTIPRRDELVRMQKKPEKAERVAETSAKWKHCAISQEELKPPIVSCELGKLYNKDAVIEHLLDKSAHTEAAHIRTLKDVVELKLTGNPAYKKAYADKGDEYVDHQTSQYICPVTGLEMNGIHKFVFLWNCGCVLSERSLKEVKSDVCHKCGRKYQDDTIKILNGTVEEMNELRAAMDAKRLQAKLEKKAHKEAKRQKVNTDGNDNSGIKTKKAKLEVDSTSKLVNGASTSKEPKASVSNVHHVILTEKKLKPSYSVSKDVQASAAFKSLFTTHEACKNQPRAHWVTYNPLYN